jgi:hypothetical protein
MEYWAEKSKCIDLLFFSLLSPSFQYSIVPMFQLEGKYASWGEIPVFPYDQQVTKALPIKIRKLRSHSQGLTILFPHP